jgi:ubiquinone/menaquinone biosynthesis C-methylase UbiE
LPNGPTIKGCFGGKCESAYRRVLCPHAMRHGYKFNPKRMAYLESEERKAMLDPAKVLPHFEIQNGWTVIDVGCGPGFFSFPLANMVGTSGRVYGIDTEPQMVRRMEEKIEERHPGNVMAVLSTEDSIPLPEGIADFALLSTVLHELESSRTLAEIKRILKEFGVLGIIDWKKKTMTAKPAYKS